MEIFNNEECRDKIISGVNKLGITVSATYGPNGQTVIIPNKHKHGEYTITKDGVSVAESIRLSDPIENIGASFVKEAAQLTVKDAGDGTTTATVLTMKLINALKDFNYKDVERCLNIVIPEIIKELKFNSITLKPDDILNVSLISCNGDLKIADLITKAYLFTHLVLVEKSTQPEDSLALITGSQFKSTYFSKNYILDYDKGFIEYENPSILIVDGKIEDKAPIVNILKLFANTSKPLIIITDGLSENVARFLEANVLNTTLKLAVIKSPGYSTHRKNLLEDLAIISNSKVFKYPLSEQDFKININTENPVAGIGSVEKIKIDAVYTTITPHKEIYKTTRVMNHISYLKGLYQTALNVSEGGDIDLIKMRLDLLKGDLAVIKVGGKSEPEMDERYDRFDDASRAVSCALNGGISTGAGVALKLATDKVIAKLINEDKTLNLEVIKAIGGALGAPYYILGGSEVTSEMKVIDPTKVIYTALTNATSVVKTILSTGAVVLNKSEWNKQI